MGSNSVFFTLISVIMALERCIFVKGLVRVGVGGGVFKARNLVTSRRVNTNYLKIVLSVIFSDLHPAGIAGITKIVSKLNNARYLSV